MEPLACLNGVISPASEAKVSIWDRGFVFGDSVYEVMRLYSGRMWLAAKHFHRLERSLAEMRFPRVDLRRMNDRIAHLVAESGVVEGTVYIQVTRGVAPRRHAFPDPAVAPTELIVVQPYDDAPTALLRESGVEATLYDDLRWKRCDVKSTNLLANCLANTAARDRGAYEAIFRDADGIVTEATHSSLLWVEGGRLIGTPEGHAILPGTTRHGLHEIAEGEGLTIHPGTIRAEALAHADEVILTGTTIEVLPVVSLDGRPVGDGRPGPIARGLHAAFRRAVTSWLATPPDADRAFAG